MGGKKFDLKDYAKKARESVADGIVLLKNEGKVLPLSGKHQVALFGRTQLNYYKSGTGSGGLVNTIYVTGIYEALEQDEDITLNADVRNAYEEWEKEHPFDAGAGWAMEPWFQEEMELSEELVKRAAEESDTALIIIGRTAGEDKDNKAEAGSYLLTELEEDMLKKVCSAFERTVVLLNVGNIIDMKWVTEVNPSSVLYVWQGGQEGGNGVLDVLKGTVTPSGRLTDTIARNAEDYPSTANHGDPDRNYYVEDIYVGYRYFETFAKDKVLYPFGYGMSYTTFTRQLLSMKETEHGLEFTVQVQNTGVCKGKESVLLFVQAPQGRLGKPSRALCGFAKTDCLEPGESQELVISVTRYQLASYDDSGATGHKSCYVLEPGSYRFYLGGDVREAVFAESFEINELTVVETLQEAMAPVEDFRRMKPEGSVDGEYCVGYEAVPKRNVNPMERREKNLLAEKTYTGDQGYLLADVAEEKISMSEFIGQFSEEDLAAIVRGEGMCPAGVTPGTAGAFGGVTDHLKAMGIPAACCADGPSGIRMDCGTKAFAMPNGTCLACTFDEELLEELYEYEGMELRKNHIDTLLGPGMNLHRSPLNGRNFEYLSEDPLVTGKLAAAQLRGMNKYGVTGTIKHFACNNQEFKRMQTESVVSERALREMYLRGFEIAVKEGNAILIMTSYNLINGLHAASNYDLLTTILREEWKFDGVVMTDWWAKGNDEGEEGEIANTAAMVRCQNDLFMVMPSAKDNTMNDNSMEAMQTGHTTRAEYQRSAESICKLLLRLPTFGFMQGKKTELDLELDKCKGTENEELADLRLVEAKGEMFAIAPDMIDTGKGQTNLYQVVPGECGVYKLVIECCVEEGHELAQIPVSIFQDHQLLKTLTLKGTDTEWRTESFELPPVISTSFFLKLYFGQGGMKIRECRFEKIMGQEEMMKMRQEI